jgi:hypothetical protein
MEQATSIEEGNLTVECIMLSLHPPATVGLLKACGDMMDISRNFLKKKSQHISPTKKRKENSFIVFSFSLFYFILFYFI